MSRSARCGSDSFRSAMNCSLGIRGSTAGEELLDLREHQIAVPENLMVGEPEYRVPGELQEHVALPVRGEPGRLAVFGTVDLDDAALVSPEQVEADRIAERMRLVGLIPFPTTGPVGGPESRLQELLGVASRMWLSGDRRIADGARITGWHRLAGEQRIVRRWNEPYGRHRVRRRQGRTGEPDGESAVVGEPLSTGDERLPVRPGEAVRPPNEDRGPAPPAT